MMYMNNGRLRSMFIAEAMNIDRYDHWSCWFMHECAVHAMKGYWSCMKTVDHSYEQALIMHDNVHIHVIMNIIVTPRVQRQIVRQMSTPYKFQRKCAVKIKLQNFEDAKGRLKLRVKTLGPKLYWFSCWLEPFFKKESWPMLFRAPPSIHFHTL